METFTKSFTGSLNRATSNFSHALEFYLVVFLNQLIKYQALLIALAVMGN